MTTVRGRTALVTGAAGGIGLAIAEALIDAGARVVLTDVDAALLDEHAARLAPHALAACLDVTDRSAWAEVRRLVERSLGPIDVLVNNAGVAPDWSDVVDTAERDFDRLLAIMLTGAFNGVRAFGPSMRERKAGHIVNVASLSGLLPSPKVGAYSAAKAALIAMSEVLRAELEPHGVGVSVVCPGAVRTALVAANPRPGAHRPNIARILEPEEVGRCLVEAIVADDMYVFTHGEARQAVAAHFAEVLRGFDHLAEREQAAAGEPAAPPR